MFLWRISRDHRRYMMGIIEPPIHSGRGIVIRGWQRRRRRAPAVGRLRRYMMVVVIDVRVVVR
jgi:hypothetical protein